MRFLRSAALEGGEARATVLQPHRKAGAPQGGSSRNARGMKTARVLGALDQAGGPP